MTLFPTLVTPLILALLNQRGFGPSKARRLLALAVACLSLKELLQSFNTPNALGLVAESAESFEET